MNLNILLEDLEMKFKLHGVDIQVFVGTASNPLGDAEINAVADRIAALRTIRFIASPIVKKIWIFSPEVFHHDVWTKLKDNYNAEPQKSMWGVAVNKGGEWKVDGPASFVYYQLLMQGKNAGRKDAKNKKIKYDWTFASPIKIQNFFDNPVVEDENIDKNRINYNK
jgi:hypothetical protein